jgi:hypothetical protein
MTSQSAFDKLEIMAKEAGAAHGRGAASWYEISEDNAAAILKGIENGDPAVLDTLPCAPLSGEWAGEPTPSSVLADIGAPASLDDAERNALLDAYETAFLDESASEIERRARYYLES